MTKILLVADTTAVLEDVSAVIDDGGTEIRELRSGAAVRDVAAEIEPDLVIADSQVQNMGGFAIAFDLANEESGGRLAHVPVLVLLDRRADVFLARRAGVEGYLVKPLDPLRLRRAVESLLAGGTFRDESFAPTTVAAD
ncbi:MAG: response regulator [Acidimicrobiales bacterium]